MSTFSHFAVKKLYFKRIFNNISKNRGPRFSQINFDQACFERRGGDSEGFGMRDFGRGGSCPRTIWSIHK